MGYILNSCQKKDDFQIHTNENEMILNIRVKEIPIYTFVFPDNEGQGNVENLLLETAAILYPELLRLAEDYVAAAAKIQPKLAKEQYAKKVKVGCIANVMKPGKENQVSIADDDWVSPKTLAACEMLQKLNGEIIRMIS